MKLFYIRHGNPIYDPDSLTPLGKRQAEAVAKRVAMLGVDKIYSSTSNRAYETALPLSEITQKEITKVEFLKESVAGEYFAIPDAEGKYQFAIYIPEIRQILVSNEVFQLGYKWYNYPEFKNYKFKEGIEFFDKNIDEFMSTLGYKHNRTNHSYSAIRENKDKIAIFAHEGVGKVFLSSLLDIPYPVFSSHFALPQTGMTVIEFDDLGDNIIPRITSLSNDAHLYKEGLPLTSV